MCLVLGLSGANLNASTTIFVTPSTAKDSVGDPVKSRATFVTGNGTVTVTLENLQTNTRDVGQNLSDLFFTLSGGQTTATLSSSSGVERQVNSDGTYTQGLAVATGWAVSADNGIELDDLGAAGPKHTIIGPANIDNKYDNANPSIAGNSSHNKFLDGTATFTLSVAGVTATDTVTSAKFSYGTSVGDNVDGVPEFGSGVLMSLVLGGFVGLFALGRLRRPAKAVAAA
jgi:hypothetical protein